MLTYLLIEKCDHFRPNMKYMLFLPYYPDLEAVNASIRYCVHRVESWNVRLFLNAWLI